MGFSIKTMLRTPKNPMGYFSVPMWVRSGNPKITLSIAIAINYLKALAKERVLQQTLLLLLGVAKTAKLKNPVPLVGMILRMAYARIKPPQCVHCALRWPVAICA